jgi:ABC-type multidrug transport system ATPase subunit
MVLLVQSDQDHLLQLWEQVDVGKFNICFFSSPLSSNLLFLPDRKTSLMNVLMGREKFDGSVSYFDQDANMLIPKSVLDRSLAYVPQDDILLREMTVTQLLNQSADWRLPSSLSAQEKNAVVDDILSKMKLSHLRNTIVGGDSFAAGISAGDRKSVNIAVEMVSKPLCLFLDEPTTNLDASSALNAAEIVNGFSRMNMTCVAVIHQPRREIFSLIDDLILLVPGGKIAYMGPSAHALEWFASVGYPLAVPTMNIADYIIDLTSGNFESCAIERHPSDTPVNWSALWLTHGETFLKKIRDEAGPATTPLPPRQISLEVDSRDVAPIANENSTKYLKVASSSPVSYEYRGGLWVQFLVSVRVTMWQHLKYNRLLLESIGHLAVGCVLGIVTCGGYLMIAPLFDTYTQSCPPGADELCSYAQKFQLGPATFYFPALLSTVVVPGAVRTFGRELAIFKRNANVGANTFAYFMGKVVVDAVMCFPKVICFVAPILIIAVWSAPFEYFLALFFVLSLYLNALSYVFSLLFSDPDLAVLFGTIYCIPINLLGGFVPLLGDGLLPNAFHPRWAARAIITAELEYGRGYSKEEINNIMFTPVWRDPDYPRDLMILLLMAAILNGIAYLLLTRKREGR